MTAPNNTMRIAVTGSQGQVALSLLERGPALGATVLALGRPQLDLARPGTIAPALASARPDIVVNAAAYTAVDDAESEPELAVSTNATGAGAVAEAASRLGIPLIHLSTDYVFDGSLERPYAETDPVAPINVYGRSKLAGEVAVAAATDDYVILRTAWVYSPFGTNFVRTMLRLAGSRPEVSVVADQRGSPTSGLDIADGVIKIGRNLLRERDRNDMRGCFHIAGEGETTWAGLAQAVFAASAAAGGPDAQVRPVATADYPTGARRPANSRLCCDKLARVHGVRLPDWRTSLEACVARLVAAGLSANAPGGQARRGPA